MVALEQTGILVISVWTEPGDDVSVMFRARIRWSVGPPDPRAEAVVSTPEDVLAVVAVWVKGFARTAE